jgi:hypothetical protein
MAALTRRTICHHTAVCLFVKAAAGGTPEFPAGGFQHRVGRGQHHIVRRQPEALNNYRLDLAAQRLSGQGIGFAGLC